jgi:hypothetical protein
MDLKGSGDILKENLRPKEASAENDCLFIWLSMFGDTTTGILVWKNRLIKF